MKVALFQMDSMWENPAWNIDKVALWAEGLPADIDLCVLPEMFATAYSMNPKRIAQPSDGEIVTRMQNLAISTGKAFIFSAAISATDREQGSEQYYNRLFFMAPDGARLVYDKRHLFRMAGEHEHYAAGTQQLIVHYKGFKICPMVCYDLRFPAWSRVAKECDLLIYIASWGAPREYAWSSLLRARAIENQCFTVGVNRVGDDPASHYSGDSVILDFMGKPIVTATPDLECSVSAELDIEALNEFRTVFPAAMDADNITINNL